MNNCFKYIVFITLFVLLAVVPEVSAQKPVLLTRELKIGMTKSQVQALLGKPQQQTDKELLKESIWVYSTADKSATRKLIFNSNSLVAFEAPLMPAQVANIPPKPEASKTRTAGKLITAKPYAFMALEDEKMLEEILKEVPSEEATPSASSPADKRPVAGAVQGEDGTIQQFFK